MNPNCDSLHVTTDQMLHELAAVVPELKQDEFHSECSPKYVCSQGFHGLADERGDCEGRGYVLPPLDSRGEPSESRSILLNWYMEHLWGKGTEPMEDWLIARIHKVMISNPSLSSEQADIAGVYQAALAEGLIEVSDEH